MSDVQKLMNEIRKAQKSLYVDIRGAVIDEGEAIMERSKNEFVPVDSGALKESGTVSVVEEGQDLDKLEVVLSYGDEKTGAYALTVHETPSGYDPPTWEGKAVQFKTGGPKYLERPLLEAENGMIERIASKVKLS